MHSIKSSWPSLPGRQNGLPIIHIWSASLQDPPLPLEQLANTLSTDEWTRANRFRFDNLRSRFIVARGLLRYLLGQYLHVEAKHLKFEYGEYGKPALAQLFSDSKLCFSLSHSEDQILYGVGCDRNIGIDLEKIRPVNHLETLAKRFFSPREFNIIQSTPVHLRARLFLRYWTCKEAYLKAIGKGLSHPLNQVEFKISSEYPIQSFKLESDQNHRNSWQIYELKTQATYVAALAIEEFPHHDRKNASIEWFSLQ